MNNSLSVGQLLQFSVFCGSQNDALIKETSIKIDLSGPWSIRQTQWELAASFITGRDAEDRQVYHGVLMQVWQWAGSITTERTECRKLGIGYVITSIDLCRCTLMGFMGSIWHGAQLGQTGPRWAPCWPNDPCYLGNYSFISYLQRWLS